MDIAYFARENTGQLVDEYYKTPTFTELSLRLAYTFDLPKVSTALSFRVA